jgi:hypothetical protein
MQGYSLFTEIARGVIIRWYGIILLNHLKQSIANALTERVTLLLLFRRKRDTIIKRSTRPVL